MISILVPSRGRPNQLHRLTDSIYQTADNCDDLEIITYVDDDDPEGLEYLELPDLRLLIHGPRILLSEAWNECWRQSQGNILMHCGDDIIFRTKSWDQKVKAAFAEYPDNIVFVHGNDGSDKGTWFGTHGFIHRDWADMVGYFVPPFFASDYNDKWLNDVAESLGRKRYVDILTEHMHPAFGKGEWDQTHKERIERHWAEDVDKIWNNTQHLREGDIERLKMALQ